MTTRRHLAHFDPKKERAKLRRKFAKQLKQQSAEEWGDVEAGTVIAEFVVDGRARAWRAPMVTKQGTTYKDADLVKWQNTVAEAAKSAMGSRLPYYGAVEAEFRFYLEAGEKGTAGDATNLVKATEDPTQGIVIQNDKQVCKSNATRIIGSENRTHIKIIAVDGKEYGL